ncbi:putative golgin subfamily A member 6-like protein 3 [Lates japonicus]|uniref:Golgin subfamily A member 6-like protein 3 n=1 Tax=Lates japonicus TaxID=270547 RepID=A0AAD3RB33_LATJO|nr:putative golgin subfamily A member 6-like protein 3 [Lates japonicus]
MEVIKPLWTFYNMVDRMKNNDEQCPHISSRLEALQEVVRFVQEKEPEQLSDGVNKALEKLKEILESANDVLTKFNKVHVMMHMVKSSEYRLQFENLNKSLTDAFITLSGALHIDQERRLIEQENKLDAQMNMLVEHDEKLVEQEKTLAEQENKLHEQERKLAKQEKKLAKQKDILERLESKLEYEQRAYYCVLQ